LLEFLTRRAPFGCKRRFSSHWGEFPPLDQFSSRWEENLCPVFIGQIRVTETPQNRRRADLEMSGGDVDLAGELAPVVEVLADLPLGVAVIDDEQLAARLAGSGRHSGIPCNCGWPSRPGATRALVAAGGGVRWVPLSPRASGGMMISEGGILCQTTVGTPVGLRPGNWLAAKMGRGLFRPCRPGRCRADTISILRRGPTSGDSASLPRWGRRHYERGYARAARARRTPRAFLSFLALLALMALRAFCGICLPGLSV